MQKLAVSPRMRKEAFLCRLHILALCEQFFCGCSNFLSQSENMHVSRLDNLAFAQGHLGQALAPPATLSTKEADIEKE